MMNDIAVVITAAGTSQRINQGNSNPIKKEYMPLKTGTVLSASVYTFLSMKCFSTLVITIPQNEQPSAAHTALLHALSSVSELLKTIRLLIVQGDTTRQASVYRALEALHQQPTTPEAVLIHDGARPWVSPEIITSVIEGIKKHGACAPAMPSTDTQKEIDDNGKIIHHLNRTHLVSVQTPQGFLFQPLYTAHTQAKNDTLSYTDDTEIWARYAGDVYTCIGSLKNKKITYREDLQQ